MKLIKYGDDILIDISTPEKEEKGYLWLFKFLDDSWCVYQDLTDTDMEPIATLKKRIQKLRDKLHELHEFPDLYRQGQNNLQELQNVLAERQEAEEQIPLYNKAKAGDWEAAKELLEWRRNGEYEEYEILNDDSIVNPLSKPSKKRK